MTTPRVTVPVEPTEAMMNACPSSFSPSFAAIWPKICRDIYRAMLSAAPAPEGGAVKEALREMLALVLLKYGNTDEAVNAAVERAQAALATREEAPAEAGELAGAIAFLDGAAVMLGRGEMPAPGSEYAARWWQAHAVALAALRAPPQAREDALPMAWAIRYAGDSDKAPLAQVTMSEEFAGVMKHQGHEVIALGPIAHPAPDALRVAVEKLEIAKTTDDPAEVFMLAMEALAALQAEQKGGA